MLVAARVGTSDSGSDVSEVRKLLRADDMMYDSGEVLVGGDKEREREREKKQRRQLRVGMWTELCIESHRVLEPPAMLVGGLLERRSRPPVRLPASFWRWATRRAASLEGRRESGCKVGAKSGWRQGGGSMQPGLQMWSALVELEHVAFNAVRPPCAPPAAIVSQEELAWLVLVPRVRMSMLAMQSCAR